MKANVATGQRLGEGGREVTWRASGSRVEKSTALSVIWVAGAVSMLSAAALGVISGSQGLMSPVTLLLVLGGVLGLCIGLGPVGRLVLTFTLVSAPLLSVSVPIDTRFVVILPLGLMVLPGVQRRIPNASNSVPIFLAIVAAVTGLSVIWSTVPGAAVQGLISMALLAWATFVIGHHCVLREVLDAVLIWAGTLLILSLLVYALGLDFSERADRFQGLVGNANGVALVALLLVGAAALRSTTLLVIVSPIAILTILLSLSRGAAIGVAVISLFAIVGTLAVRFGLLWAIVTSVVLGLGLAIAQPFASLPVGSGILRTTNSRQDVWSALISQFLENPLIGVGWGGNNSGSESFYLVLLATLGLFGLILAVSTVVLLIARLHVLGPGGWALTLGILVESVFEGWLLTGGSAYAWTVWAVAATSGSALVVTARESRSQGQQPVDSLGNHALDAQ